MKLFKTYIPYLAVGAVAFVFAILSEWNDDGIAYSFTYPDPEKMNRSRR